MCIRDSNNALGGEYQKYVGGMYHAMEIFNSFYDAEKLINNSITNIGESHGGWTRVAQWLPWMEMGDKPGLMIFNASVFNTFELEKVSERLVDILKNRYPSYLEPPPLNDERPNEIVPSFFCPSTNGSIIPSSKAFFFIQLSDMIVILIFFLLPSLKLFSFS